MQREKSDGALLSTNARLPTLGFSITKGGRLGSKQERIYQLDLLNLDTETVKNLCALPDLDAGTENKYMVTMNARIKLKKLKGTKEKDIGYRDTSNIQYRCHKLENRMTVEVPATVDEKWTALKGKDHKGN